jgi:hypothetical protein
MVTGSHDHIARYWNIEKLLAPEEAPRPRRRARRARRSKRSTDESKAKRSGDESDHTNDTRTEPEEEEDTTSEKTIRDASEEASTGKMDRGPVRTFVGHTGLITCLNFDNKHLVSEYGLGLMYCLVDANQ